MIETAATGSPSGRARRRSTAKQGTKLGRRGEFSMCDVRVPISGRISASEGKAGRMGARMMAIVAKGDRGRVYLEPTRGTRQRLAQAVEPAWRPENEPCWQMSETNCR